MIVRRVCASVASQMTKIKSTVDFCSYTLYSREYGNERQLMAGKGSRGA